MSKYLDTKDTFQGLGGRNYDTPFGYCGISDRGGQFFSHCPTLAETLASIEDDETDPPENWPRRAYQEVRGFVPRQWAAGKIRGRVSRRDSTYA